MYKFRTQLLATAAVVALSGAASAADMPVKAPVAIAPYSWTGFYLGGNIGIAQLHSSANTLATNVGPGGLRACSTNPAFPSCSMNVTGLTGGFQGGYDWQINNVVLGVAADWSWTGLNKTQTSNTLSNPFFQAKIDWLASFRGRIGWAFDDKTLLYGTGGVAWAGLKSNAGMTGPTNFTSYTNTLNTTKTGWVAGGGIEHRLTKNWSVMGEALYYDFGRTTNISAPSTGPGSGFTYQTEFKHTVFQTRVGVNYRF